MTTKEEAIKIFQDKIETMKDGAICCNYGNDKDAFLLAIQLLKQEPCEDAISRQAVLDEINRVAVKVFETYDDYANFYDFVAELSPVNPQKPICPSAGIDCEDCPAYEKKTGWIPVSERLPEDETYVLTTIKVPNRIAHARSGWYEGGLFYNDNGDTWKATDMEVKAWMPLPEPYKAESESI